MPVETSDCALLVLPKPNGELTSSDLENAKDPLSRLGKGGDSLIKDLGSCLTNWSEESVDCVELV